MPTPAAFRATALTALLLAGCGGGSSPSSTRATEGLEFTANNPQPVPSTGAVADPGTPYWADGDTATGGHGLPIGGVNCLTAEDFHQHAHVAIINNGKVLALPAQIGLQGCAYEMHTHDTTGVVHIEAASERHFTLGQFFAVWGQPVTRANVAGLTDPSIRFWVDDGQGPSEFKDDPATIELRQHRLITITLGPTPAVFPAFVFPAGL